eukprot:16880_1
MSSLVIDDNLSIWQSFFYYSSGVGGICGLFCNILMLFHISKSFYKQQTQSIKRKQPKPAHESNHLIYYITTCYLVSGILICLIYSMIRSNIITRITLQQFSSTQCALGYYLALILNIINKALMYSLFFYRLKVMFKDSMYQYSSKWFKILFICMLSEGIICIAVVAFAYFNNIFSFFPTSNHDGIQWVLRHHAPSNLIYCAMTGDQHWIVTLMRIKVLCFELIFTAIFMYMFIYRLHVIRNSLIKRYMGDMVNLQVIRRGVTEHSNDSENSNTSFDSQMSSDESDDHDAEMTASNGMIHRRYTDTMSTIEGIAKEYNKCEYKDISRRQSIGTIIKLHELIKKKTILGFIAVASSTMYWIISALIYNVWATQIVWDVLINSLCVWLMFASSKIYWNMCTTYCCCYFCYKKIEISK